MKKRIVSLLMAGILCLSSSMNVLADTASGSDLSVTNTQFCLNNTNINGSVVP